MSYLSSKSSLQSLDEVFVKTKGGDINPLKLKSLGTAQNNFILDFEEIDNVEAAAALIGAEVLIAAERFKKLPEGEYYWWEIIGLEVVTEDGVPCGKIVEILPTGSNDVYVCSGPQREVLLPAISDVIRRIDRKKGMMIVRLIDGL